MSPANILPPRVALPGATEEQEAAIEAVREGSEWDTYWRQRFIRALFSKRERPFLGVRKPRSKPTKHQRHKAAVAVRSAYLKERAA